MSYINNNYENDYDRSAAASIESAEDAERERIQWRREEMECVEFEQIATTIAVNAVLPANGQHNRNLTRLFES